MSASTLVSAPQLHENLGDPGWVVIDCRFSLDDPDRGRRDYLHAHVPGALYAHLDEDLSGPIHPGRTGRHPLPDPEVLARTFSGWGIGSGTQVVAYDDSGGSIAARLWWCLHWLGHRGAALLDGGWQAWQALGYPFSRGPESRQQAEFVPDPNPEMRADVDLLLAHLDDPSWRIVDSRAPERFRGDEEPLDSVAGRIPGAVNAPHSDVLSPDGKFRSPSELRRMFEALLEGRDLEQTVFYCGSGVSAAQNLLAMRHAGLPGARLYAGSWSHWITDRSRPIARGQA